MKSFAQQMLALSVHVTSLPIPHQIKPPPLLQYKPTHLLQPLRAATLFAAGDEFHGGVGGVLHVKGFHIQPQPFQTGLVQVE